VVTEANATALVARIRATLVDRLEFPGVVDWFLGDGWKPWFDGTDPEFVDEIETWKDLHDDILREHGPDDLTLNVYLQQMDLAPKTSRPGRDAVRLMTVHGSKGLEFRHVYLIGMAQEVFPAFQAVRKGLSSRELEEERRNCFVAITRVQDSLTLTRALEYNGWSKKPSQFLKDMGLESDPTPTATA
jgi:DNA helicase-2/ATP-dependent DNA helicase PcrA